MSEFSNRLLIELDADDNFFLFFVDKFVKFVNMLPSACVAIYFVFEVLLGGREQVVVPPPGDLGPGVPSHHLAVQVDILALSKRKNGLKVLLFSFINSRLIFYLFIYFFLSLKSA